MNLQEGDVVNLFIERETPLGYSVLIEGEYEGLLYKNECFTEVEEEMEITGFIKNIREDGKIDVSLRPQGYSNLIDNDTAVILEKLKQSPDGYVLVTDKSSPERIKDLFGLSKKSFKKAVGSLYKQKFIVIKEDRIELLEKG
ncbi:MAG: DNA-binding protein [Nonlabens sp.]